MRAISPCGSKSRDLASTLGLEPGLQEGPQGWDPNPASSWLCVPRQLAFPEAPKDLQSGPAQAVAAAAWTGPSSGRALFLLGRRPGSPCPASSAGRSSRPLMRAMCSGRRPAPPSCSPFPRPPPAPRVRAGVGGPAGLPRGNLGVCGCFSTTPSLKPKPARVTAIQRDPRVRMKHIKGQRCSSAAETALPQPPRAGVRTRTGGRKGCECVCDCIVNGTVCELTTVCVCVCKACTVFV